MGIIKEEVAKLLLKLRDNVPLVHNITNYVTVNGVANTILAVGGSPIMADDMEEVRDITGLASALVINIGTLNQRTVESMIAAGKKANELGIPVVFDPVGAGASAFRNKTTRKLMEEVKLTIIRGNLSEISFVAGISSSTKGVDSSEEDEKNDSVAVAKHVAKEFGCVVAITGVTDIISDGTRVVKIYNGTRLLSKVTGTGCMTTGLIGAYAGVAKDYLIAATAGVATMAIAGEISIEKYGDLGTGSFNMGITDAISIMDDSIILERAKFDEE